mmetsp:Transcript_9063/g.18713  ORF Transcript_9063/g.18713 Transcript_9063/m.18713 type:complete len:499 (+) Transcript_9063:124-1620(+)
MGEAQSQAIIATADDAVLAKLSCVERGYYDDPFISAMAIGASSASGLSTPNPPLRIPLRYSKDSDRVQFSSSGQLRLDKHHRPLSPGSARKIASGFEGRMTGEAMMNRFPPAPSTEPIIRRGTHARVAAIDQTIRAFLSLSPGAEKQIVILGAGRDTTCLRYLFGFLQNHVKNTTKLSEKDGDMRIKLVNVKPMVKWYEVDHPSVICAKARSWLPGCIPEGYKYQCTQITGCDKNETSKSYSIRISEENAADATGCSIADENDYYHLIGHDLRSPPSELFSIFSHHGYDSSNPTLFVFECVMMYLPDVVSRDLLRFIVESANALASPTATNPFVAVAIYDPIPCNDRFGQVMILNLQKRGILGNRHGRRNFTNENTLDVNKDSPLSLEKTRTLSDQLAKLIQSGFDIAVGCHMMDAFDHGIVSIEERKRSTRCDMLDELEEFVLLMKHYCLVVGVRSCDADGGDCTSRQDKLVGYQLCSMGEESPIGFQEGFCTVARK